MQTDRHARDVKLLVAEYRAVRCDDLLGFLRGKLEDAQKALRAREQGEECWRSGDGKSWRAVGCSMTKSQRLKLSEREGRIAEKYRRDVEMYQAVIVALDKPNVGEQTT